MELNVVQRSELDPKKWDELVSKTTDVAIFSYTWYLDAVAENWCVLVDKNYTVGIALPFTRRLGQSILYTPIFVSYLELLGMSSVYEAQIARQIQASFNIIEIEFKQPLLGPANDGFVTQQLRGAYNPNGQVKRILNKSMREGLNVVQTNDWKTVFGVIKSELHNKFSGMTELSLGRLKKAYEKAYELGCLTVFEVRNDETCVGGIICFQDEKHLFYSKGATLASAKESGGMYAAIDGAITHAVDNNLWFDFGGSRVEGVRRFNKQFGGEDLTFFSYRIDNGPWWFRWLRSIKSNWFKKSS